MQSSDTEVCDERALLKSDPPTGQPCLSLRELDPLTGTS